MIVLAWVLSCSLAFLLGHYFGDIRKRVAVLEQSIKAEVDKPDEPEAKSLLIDPDDPVQTAIYEHDKMMKKLNLDE
jgi:hypothetical protein